MNRRASDELNAFGKSVYVFTAVKYVVCSRKISALTCPGNSPTHRDETRLLLVRFWACSVLTQTGEGELVSPQSSSSLDQTGNIPVPSFCVANDRDCCRDWTHFSLEVWTGQTTFPSAVHLAKEMLLLCSKLSAMDLMDVEYYFPIYVLVS
jgi:hypothetical protein